MGQDKNKDKDKDKQMNKKEGLQQTFDTVASGYDNPALSFFPNTAKSMVEYLSLPSQTESTLLDVCTGTGVVALQAARQSPSSIITGIDLSTGMLAQAISKAEQHKLINVSFRQMDLDQLDFPQQYFDYATCSFGLFFLDDMQQGLRNIINVVKAEGKIAISTFRETAFEPMSVLFLQRYEAMGYEVPPLSWKQMTTNKQLHALFSAVGIKDIDIHREAFGYHLSNANDWWDVVWNAGYRGLLAKMSEADMTHFKTKHLQDIQKLCDSGDTWLDTGVAIAIGQVNHA